MITQAVIVEVQKRDSKGTLIDSTTSAKLFSENINLSDKAKNSDYFYSYILRIPFIDGMDNAELIPDSQLAIAVAITPPHMHKILYVPGDLVYVSFENLDLSYPIILGMAPNSQEVNINGSIQSSTKLALEEVSDLITDKYGNVVLPYNTLIRADSNTSLYNNETYVDSDKTPYVTAQNLSYIRGVNAPILALFKALGNSIATSLNTLADAEIVHTVAGREGSPLILVNKDKWVGSGEYPGNDITYTFIYDTSTQLYYSKLYKSRIYDEKAFGEIGITFVDFQNTGDITITLKQGVIPIERGGTNANNVKDARTNLGLKGNIIIDLLSFDNLGTNLLPDTIYFIY